MDNKVLSKTFLWMFLGLIVTGVVAWGTYSSRAIFANSSKQHGI